MTYSIIRFFRDERPREIIETGLTLEEAQAHCKDPATHEVGVYFDGYEEE